MYSPPFYREERRELIENLICENPFATLLTVGGGEISHLPLKFDGSQLIGHMARANPHWRELSEKESCKAIFQGPHGYISPAWYKPQPDNVPTWSYIAVHITGKFKVLDEPETAFSAMKEMVQLFESAYRTNWQFPINPEITQLMKSIIVFRIVDLQFDAKFKLAQRLDVQDRENVISQLKASGDQILIDLAAKMHDI